MKRKNRLTLNFLLPTLNPKRRRTFRIHKEIIPVQHPVQRVDDVPNVPEADMDVEDFVSHDTEDSV